LEKSMFRWYLENCPQNLLPLLSLPLTPEEDQILQDTIRFFDLRSASLLTFPLPLPAIGHFSKPLRDKTRQKKRQGKAHISLGETVTNCFVHVESKVKKQMDLKTRLGKSSSCTCYGKTGEAIRVLVQKTRSGAENSLPACCAPHAPHNTQLGCQKRSHAPTVLSARTSGDATFYK
jgi:hypothetical protein